VSAPTHEGSPDVLVVGAGITGVTTALALAEAGARVEVIERWIPAAMASGWTLAGVRQSGRDPAELALARHAVALWQDLDEWLGKPTGYRQSGNLRLARDEDEAPAIKALVDEQGRAGLDITLLDPAAIREIAPAISPRVPLASWCPTDGQADPIRTSQAYRQAAERLGVRFRIHTRVDRLEVRGGRFHALVFDGDRRQAGACVLATGVHTTALLADVGVHLPIRTAAVTVVRSAAMTPSLGPVIGVAGANLAIRQQDDGRFRFTGGAEAPHAPLIEDQRRPRVPVRAASLAAVIERAIDVLPMLAEADVTRSWSGLLDMTPDALPVMDRVGGIDDLVVAAGFSGHGFGIGPAVGPCLAALTLGRPSPVALDAFALGRFDGITQAGPTGGVTTPEHTSLATPTLHG